MEGILISNSDEETRSFGARLAEELIERDVVLFYGGLGSGKTCMIQGVCRGLGIRQPVTSPTFTLVNEYRGKIPVYHMDFYRIGGPEEALELGWEEYIFGRGICLVEWAEKIGPMLPPHSITIGMEMVPSHPEKRRITVVRK